MKRLASFISENSLGLTVSENLKNILLKKYSSVVPLMPWLTREGSSISKLLHKNDLFKVVGCYPRRPKINELKEYNFKVGKKIIESSEFSENNGLPIILSMPIIQNFWELSEKPFIIYSKIDFDINEDYLITVDSNRNFSNENQNKFTLTSNEILDIVENRSEVFNVESLFRLYREINILNNYGFGFYSTYKPLLFLIKQN
jgi:hypothetical protein